MAREYYYLIAGLPDLFLDQEKKDFNLIRIKDEMQELLHPDDFKLVELLLLEYDNDNFQNFLFDRKNDFNPLGKFPKEFYAEFEENLEFFPEYIISFYNFFKGKADDTEEFEESTDYAGEKIEKSNEVRFQEYFYGYISKFDNEFIAGWFRFLCDYNNILSAINCRKHGIDISPQMVGKNELVENLTRSQTPDFGIKKEIDYFDQIFQITDIPDILERERRLDMLKWEIVDNITTFNYFTIERILAFFIKAGIVYRWTKLDAKTGAQMFQKLVNDLRQTYELPKEFAK